MHIAIEGIDGVGKTTIARGLADWTGFRFVEKHLHPLLDGEDVSDIPNYMRITGKINASQDKLLRAWFYALGNLYLREHYGKIDIVTDRYFASNYSWNRTSENEFIFDDLIKVLGKPDITFLIYANPGARAARLVNRNPQDPDLRNSTVEFSEMMYNRLTWFLKKYEFRYFTVDTSDFSIEESMKQIKSMLHQEFPDKFSD